MSTTAASSQQKVSSQKKSEKPVKQQLTEGQRAQLERCSLYQFIPKASSSNAGAGLSEGGEQGSTKKHDDPLIRREQFAINLRKQKRGQIISSKRKKTFEAINLMKQKQKTIEVVTNSMAGGNSTSNLVPIYLQSAQGMENAILSLGSLVADPQKADQLLDVLIGMRNITAQTDIQYTDAFHTLMLHPQSLGQLVIVLQPSVSKQSISNKNERQKRLNILCEALWTLNNITAEDEQNIDQRLFADHNITHILQCHLQENFIPESASDQQQQPLEDYEMELLKEILWCMSNMANYDEIAISFTMDGLIEKLYLIARNYHEQFSFDIWRVLIWNMRNMSQAFSFLDKNQIDVNASFSFLQSFEQKIYGHLLDTEHIEYMQVRDQMRKDFVWFVGISFRHFTDEQIVHFTQAPYSLAVTMTTLLKEIPKHQKIADYCIRVLGELIVNSEELCSYIVSGSTNEDLQLLPSLQRALVDSDVDAKKSALWLLGNIAVNSMEDLTCLIQNGIVANMTINCRDNDISVKTEAIYTMGNVIIKLCNEKQLHLVKNLLLQYDIEATMLEVLRNDWNSPENQQIALMLYQSLFGLQSLYPGEPTEGARYQQNFEVRGGLDELEQLQTDGKQEIYELAQSIVANFFGYENDENYEPTPITSQPQSSQQQQNPENVFRI